VPIVGNDMVSSTALGFREDATVWRRQFVYTVFGGGVLPRTR
jgi:hypothetical protein